MSDLSPDRPSFTLGPSARPFLVVVGLVAVMWAVELVDLLPSTSFDSWGIEPRQLQGLTGIVAAPFLHDGFGHLLGNTIPFLVLGCVIALDGLQRFVQVTIIVGIVAGLGTWLVSPGNTVHIGASGIVFGYLTYLISRGAFERKLVHFGIGVVVLVFYGSILWGLVPRPGVSWQGHLFGAIGGVIAAWFVHRRPTT